MKKNQELVLQYALNLKSMVIGTEGKLSLVDAVKIIKAALKEAGKA